MSLLFELYVEWFTIVTIMVLLDIEKLEFIGMLY